MAKDAVGVDDSQNKPETKPVQNGTKTVDATKCSHKPVTLKNHTTGRVFIDTLHSQGSENGCCSNRACYGSIVFNNFGSKPSRTREVLLKEAKDFLDQYYRSLKRYGTKAHETRWSQIQSEVENTGTYNMTETEIVFGAKLAWRNAQRCIGRIQWNKLQVFDARYVGTAQGMFEAICNHIRYSTNKGNLRSAITIFPPSVEGRSDFRIWNGQFIGYAGYLQPDGSIIGDPANAEFTQVCQRFGWMGKGTRFDILPLILQGPDGEAKLFQIPEEMIFEVPISHPEFDWFAELGLKWYALPAVSGMKFDCGGLEYTAAPFSGWYMVTEIGTRDLGDPYRYNQLEVVATQMGLDTRTNSSLWKDKAVVELNLAILHSFQRSGVTIVDHHTASETFMKHIETEFRVRGGCPGDWVWLIPPTAGSLCPVYHQEVLSYTLKPTYDYQEPAWKTYDWRKNSISSNGVSRKFRFKEIARAVKFTSKLFGQVLSKRIKATILYATETGKSATFANQLGEIFSHAFHPQVTCMTDYDLAEIEHENIVLVVASTFGNGDPPENGEKFARELYAMKLGSSHEETENSDGKQKTTRTLMKMNSVEPTLLAGRQISVASVTSCTSDLANEEPPLPLSNVRFSVFALGSSAYPNFCAFGKCIDSLLGDLGGEKLLSVTCGDELSGQEQAFKEWAVKTYQLACETFCIEGGLSEKDISKRLRSAQKDESSVRFAFKDSQTDLCSRLGRMHSRKVLPMKLKSNENLLPKKAGLSTLSVCLSWEGLEPEKTITFIPGDHVGVFARNRKEIVEGVLSKLKNCPDKEKIIQIQLLEEIPTIAGPKYVWNSHGKLPNATIEELFYNFLDITTPPTQQLLAVFAQRAGSEEEKKELSSLATNTAEYDTWKHWKWPHLLEVFEEFPSISMDAALLVSLLPLMQPRFYSVSSSLVYFPEEVHLTVGVVQFRGQGDNGPLHYGVCSNYLLDAQKGDIVPAFFRSEPRFHLPTEGKLPVVMIGPGTGVAPFRAFWQEKLALSKIEKQGELLLFFGCRTDYMDLYHDEKEYMLQKGILSLVPLALSRQPDMKKTYVQDRLVEDKHSRQVYDFLAIKGGHFYVCGDCTMAEDVSKALRLVFERAGSLTEYEADRMFLKLQEEGRYHEDIFGITLRAAEIHSKSHESARIRKEIEQNC